MVLKILYNNLKEDEDNDFYKKIRKFNFIKDTHNMFSLISFIF